MHAILRNCDESNVVVPQLISCVAACWDIVGKELDEYSIAGKLVADHLWACWQVTNSDDVWKWSLQLRSIGESCDFDLLSKRPSSVNALWKNTVAVFGHEIEYLLDCLDEFLTAFDTFISADIYEPILNRILTFDCESLLNESTTADERAQIVSAIRAL